MNQTPREGDTWQDREGHRWLIIKVNFEKNELFAENVELRQLTKPGDEINAPNIYDVWAENMLKLHYRPETVTSTPSIEENIERLEPFILDPTKVHETVPFTQFVKGESLYVGLFLPRWHEITDKTGTVQRRVQRQKPVIIGSQGQFFEVKHDHVEELAVNFHSIPAELPPRWSLPAVQKYLTGNIEYIDPRELYQEIREAYEHYLYFRPEWYTVHPLWDIGTYFFMLFHAYPYLELRGVLGSAKSKIMQLSRRITYNATRIMTSPTEATLFRETDAKRPTTYLDEAESLFRKVKGKIEHDGRVEVLNSGYNRDGSVPRMEARGKTYVTQIYHTYSPKMIASINGLYGATESRAIVHVTVRAPDDDSRGEREIESHDPRWKEIRDKLFLFMFQEWKTVKENYARMLRENPTKLKKRDFQLWRPILAVAQVIGQDVYDETLECAERVSRQRKYEQFSEDSMDYILLRGCYQYLSAPGDNFIPTNLIQSWFPEDRQPHGKTISRHMKNLGLGDYWEHTREGNGYRIPLNELENIISTLAPTILPSQRSLPSQKQKVSDEEQGSADVKESEGNTDSVKVACEGMKEHEGNEPRIEHVQDILPSVKTLGNGQPVAYEDVLKLWPDKPETFETAIHALKERGDVYEPKPGYLEVLE